MREVWAAFGETILGFAANLKFHRTNFTYFVSIKIVLTIYHLNKWTVYFYTLKSSPTFKYHQSLSVLSKMLIFMVTSVVSRLL